jgi:dolichol-phosphate mannosyltransferase
MKVSILIPTKDEPYVNQLVADIHQKMKAVDHEVIVIDKSIVPPKLEGAELVLQKSKGLGNAVLEGLGHAHGDVIVTMDGDGSHRPDDVLKLLAALENADIVIGSKFVDGGETRDQYHRKMISDAFRALESAVLHIGINDPMSGFAAVRREVYDSISLNPLGYKINMEIMYKAKKRGFRIEEVPIVFNPRLAGQSKSNIQEGLRTLFFIFKLKLGY